MLKDPLFHFLLIGAAVFALFYQVADPNIDRPNRIVVTAGDMIACLPSGCAAGKGLLHPPSWKG